LIVVIAYIKVGVKLSLFNIYFGLFFLFYGPAFFIYNNDKNLFETDYAIDSAFMLILFLLSFFLGRYLFLRNKNKDALKKINYNNWIKLPDNQTIVLKVGWLKAFIVAIAAIVFTGLFFYGGISSLAKAVTTSYPDEGVISGLRSEAGVNGWIAPLYTYVLTGIARLTAFLFIGWAYKKRSFNLKVISFAFALFISIGYLANLSKSGFIVYLTQLIFFLLLLYNIKINYKKVILILSIIFPLLIIVYMLATNAGSSSGALKLLADRIFDEPIRCLQLYPYYYPKIYPYTYGMNIRVIHDMFSNAHYVPANVLVSGSQFNQVTFNAMFIADAYVDFSYPGVIVQSIFVGYYLSYLDVLIFRGNSYMKKALFAAVLIGIFNLINAGLVVSFFAFGLITLPIFMRLLTKRKPKIHLREKLIV
jgi:oligosaccharide repeat unit polymerase